MNQPNAALAPMLRERNAARLVPKPKLLRRPSHSMS